jgi:outer membrane lipopolysaccharide assembly protein LptE/RlpB
MRTILLLSLCLLSGCAGYRSGSLFPQGARRIAVPIFENETFFRLIEVDLTRSICDELRSRPGIHVTSEADADIILEGVITDVDQRVLAITKRDRATESSATTSVKCRVIDAKTRKVLKDFTEKKRIDFALATGEGLQTAQREAFYELAREIVYQLEADW